jgi:hypothetical protein
MRTADNDNHDAISHEAKYTAFLKDLAKRHPPKAPIFRTPMPTGPCGFAWIGTDAHPMRQKLPPVKDAEGMYVSAPRELVKAESVNIPKPWFMDKRPRLASHTFSTSTPEERAAGRARYAAVHGEKGSETKAIAKLVRAIAKRQSFGDPNCELHRGNDCPLLTNLKREGHEEFAALVLAYRKLAATAAMQPVQSMTHGYDASINVQMRSERLTPEQDIEDAAAIAAANDNKWPELPRGEIRYKNEVVRIKGNQKDIAARRKKPVDSDCESDSGHCQGYDKLHENFSASSIDAHIDAKKTLGILRATLGPLLTPFEDAALAGMTMTQVGRKEGFSIKPDLVGKALCHRALATLRWVLHDLDTLERLHAADNDNNVQEIAIAV